MPSLVYLCQVEDGFDGSFGSCQHAEMGGVDRGSPNLRVTRHSLHYSIKMISYTIGAADVTHANMGGAR